MCDSSVLIRIMESARRLGLSSDSPAINEAVAIADEASMAGFSPDDSFEFARAVLCRAANPVNA